MLIIVSKFVTRKITCSSSGCHHGSLNPSSLLSLVKSSHSHSGMSNDMEKCSILMETVTCHLLWAGAKEAANYSLTCKYSWKMIVLIWTSAMLIKYFDYFWDRLWEKGGGVVKGINLLIAEIKLSSSETAAEGYVWIFLLLFSVLLSLTYCFESSHHFSACSWSPLALCLFHFLKIITHLPSWAGRNLNGRDKEELLAGNQDGSCLSHSPWPSSLLHSQNFQPRNSLLPAPTLDSPCKYQHKIVAQAARRWEREGEAGATQRSRDHLSKKLLKTSVGSETSGQDTSACLTHP